MVGAKDFKVLRKILFPDNLTYQYPNSQTLGISFTVPKNLFIFNRNLVHDFDVNRVVRLYNEVRTYFSKNC